MTEPLIYRIVDFLERCIDSPDTYVRREATAFYGEIADRLEEVENDPDS